MKTESILAVPTTEVWNILDYVPQGVIVCLDFTEVDRLLEKAVFNPRNVLEDDPRYKQIIPYAVICHCDDVYLFKRLKETTEKRLHNLYSLGVGGHMNKWGANADVHYIRHELARELHEEVLLKDGCSIIDLKPLGYINDDTNDVGKVHLGILYEIELSSKDIEINEKEKMEGQWIKKSELLSYRSGMESWSQIYCDLKGVN